MTGEVPCAIIANVQTEWWTKWFFVVFKVPPPGGRHVFRKGEPFAQIIFVPQRVSYDIVRMSEEEAAARREDARVVDMARAEIGTNLWNNASGGEQSNHYKVLAAAFSRDGQAGVNKVMADAIERRREQLPTADKPIPEVLAQGAAAMNENRYAEARDIYMTVLTRQPNHPEALANYGICLACLGSTVPGLRAIAHAVALEPNNPARHNSLGEMLRLLGRFPESETAFRNSLKINPNNPSITSILSQVIAQQGRHDEALALADRVLAMSPQSALAHLRRALILEQAGRIEQARATAETAVKLDPKLPEAQSILARLSSHA
jgi:Flp pilus assembly protein TadD